MSKRPSDEYFDEVREPWQKTEEELEFDREVENTPDEYYKTDPDDDDDE